jgi:hypothetical protein
MTLNKRTKENMSALWGVTGLWGGNKPQQFSKRQRR